MAETAAVPADDPNTAPADAAVSQETLAPPDVPLDVSPGENPPHAAVRPAHYWTWRLLSSGFSTEECVAIRGLEQEVILDHALRAVDSGWPVQAGWCLEPDLLSALEAVVGDRRPEQIRPLLARLPDGTRYEQVELFLKCRGE